LATAENTAYAYDDGEILGSGRIDIETMKIDFTKISPHKFEGLYFQKNKIQFLICEDNNRYSRKHHLQTNYRP
jgi:hypothetical protein